MPLQTNRPNQKDSDKLKKQSDDLQGGMGAIAWAVLEMFRRGGMEEKDVQALHAQMKHFFMKPSNEECNLILKVVEARLREDKEPSGIWYN